jgi:hypothetical protein
MKPSVFLKNINKNTQASAHTHAHTEEENLYINSLTHTHMVGYISDDEFSQPT